MGTDTKAYLPNVKREQLIDFIRSIATVVREPTTSNWKELIMFSFEYRGSGRTMNIYDLSIDTDRKKYQEDSLNYVNDWGLPDKSRGQMCSLGYNDMAVEIMTMLCYMFGGYLTERDTDDKKYKHIARKGPHGIIRLLFQHK